jgi:hypothetical protein
MARAETRLAAVEALLRERGPMTAARIAEELDVPTDRITLTIQSARSRRPGRSFRIIRYEPQIGVWASDRPVWSRSDGRDVPRPLVDKKARADAYQKRYREKHAGVRRVRMAARNAARRSTAATGNPYLQLVKASSRGYVAAMAAANTAMTEAA